MESSSKTNLPIPILVVLYDFRYMWKDNREISVKKGEKLFLLEKTNRDWWQVVRPSERKSFFVPAQYVELLSKRKQDGETFSGFTAEDSVLYENLDNLKQQQLTAPPLSRMCKSDYTGTRYGREECGRVVLDIGRQKPVPKTRTKVTTVKNVSDDDDRCDNGESVSPTDFIPGLDPNSSFKQKIDSDKTDKKSNEKNKQEFISNLPQELSVLPDGNKSYRGRSAPVAVENLVYCKVPVDGIKSYNAKQKVKSSGLPNKVNLDTGKNRMKNSYNLKTKPSLSSSESQGPTIPVEKDHHQSGHPVVRNEKLQHFNQAFSKSLEKLAEEIQFEPKKVTSGPKPASPVDNTTKSRPVKMVKDTSEKRVEKKGKSNDASIILDENKIQPQSRSVFSRFRRSLHHSNSFKANNLKKMSKNSSKACELSLSWEGGLDKIQEKKENDEKPMVTPMGLQRSRTFMFAERSPLSVRPANKIFSGKHRLDTAYHSQRKPDEKVTLSTFKPIFNLDVTQGTPAEQKKSPKGTEAKPESNRDKMHGIVSGSVKEKERIKEGNHNEEPKKETVESRSQGEVNRSIRINHPIKLENVTKVYKSAAVPETLLDYRNHPESEALTLYSEPYCSNSESEDNLEEKSLSVIVNKSLRSQSSNDSHLTVSEGTEASESDENSLELTLDSVKPLNRQPVNKRRTSLVRSSRVS
ncbi:hypothetical protein RUM43_004631 [Polyplax serrata]|uniref:SH3 domain-containing protein n=1 Tax=Polyplax serrata TaxID=468196 RepID=A0AAN8SB15_POLSC